MNHLMRRDFLSVSAAAAGTAALGTLASGCRRAPGGRTVKWKHALCNEAMVLGPEKMPWERQCAVTAEAGYEGIEIAPFTLVTDGVGELNAAARSAMVKAMEKEGIRCAGLHWLLAPPPKGLHFTTPDAAVRERTIAYVKELIDFCADLHGDIMVFGSPKQRNTVDGATVEAATQRLAEGFAAVADHARTRGVTICLEALDRTQTDVVNTLAQVMQVVQQVNHPHIRTMFDFHNTPDETDPSDVLIRRHFKDMLHVHVQEMDGTHLGTGDAVHTFVKSFQALKDLGYDRWVSVEVFDFAPGGVTIAQESMKVLRAIEAKLV